MRSLAVWFLGWALARMQRGMAATHRPVPLAVGASLDVWRPAVVWRYSSYLSPHPHRHEVLHVVARTPSEAWAVIRGAA